MFGAALLGGATLLSAADEKPAAEPVPWQVPEAAVRVPVSISPGSATRALGRMPPDMFLSEHKPLKADGLTFVPETTNTPKEENMEGQWKPALNGTATYALKPEYTHFTCWLGMQENRDRRCNPLTLSFDEGKSFVPPKYIPNKLPTRFRPPQRVVGLPATSTQTTT